MNKEKENERIIEIIQGKLIQKIEFNYIFLVLKKYQFNLNSNKLIFYKKKQMNKRILSICYNFNHQKNKKHRVKINY